MPRMDGIETLRLIMRSTPLPVILFSTHSKEGAYSTFKALAFGAQSTSSRKPKDAAAGNLDAIAEQLIEKVKVAKRAGGKRLQVPPIEERRRTPPKSPAAIRFLRTASSLSEFRPAARRTLFNLFFHKFPESLPARSSSYSTCRKVLQKCLPKRLDECCQLDVHEARSGDLLLAGRVLICPGNRHMMVRHMPRGAIWRWLSDAPHVERPSSFR